MGIEYDQKLYEKFGYYIKLLDDRDAIAMFVLLSGSRLHRESATAEQYSEDRKQLKEEIKFTLHNERYNSIGIYTDEGVLIGVSLSSISEEESLPWMGYFAVDKKYRTSRVSAILLNYVANHLYGDFNIQIGMDKNRMFGKLVRLLPIVLGYAVLLPETKKRIAKICNEDTGSEE